MFMIFFLYIKNINTNLLFYMQDILLNL